MIHDPPHPDSHWMNVALAEARLAASDGEVPVGAVVVKGNRLLATGRNAPIAGHDPTAHAEIVALRAAARVLGNYRLEGCTLYATLEPCAMCSGAMLHARLSRVVFGAGDDKTGAAGGVVNLFANSSLNHHTTVQGGVLADQCAHELTAFFKARRTNVEPLREDALRTPANRFEGLDLPQLAPYQFSVAHLPALAGLRMHVLDTGPADGPTVMVVHGPWGWGRDGQALALALQRLGARAVLPDLPGFGRSDKPKKFAAHTLDWHQRCLQELAKDLGLQDVTLLVPHVPVVMALAQSLCQADDQHRFSRVVGWYPVSITGSACPTWDAPFPDAGHRAAQRAFAAWNSATSKPTALQVITAIPLKVDGQLARYAAPAWAQWSGAHPPQIPPVSDEAELAQHLVALASQGCEA